MLSSFRRVAPRPDHMVDSPRKFRIVVVDDERSIADTLTAILNLNGYEAFAAYSAEEAVLWCLEKQPDVVISDVVMGPMNGLRLAAHLAAHQPDCRVILVSGHGLTSALIQASDVDRRPVRVLAKPVHPQEILDMLASGEHVTPASPS
jgi:DNA-binding NtrC family response regulator